MSSTEVPDRGPAEIADTLAEDAAAGALSPPEAAGASLPPRALIVTIYGLYARDAGGWLSVSTLIRLMICLDVDEPAVRSSISRLKRRGILQMQRVDGAAGYRLSPQARHILDLGDRRIFDRAPARVPDGFLLAVFSVPEAQRNKRHLLRSRLARLGFGTVGSGVWIAPAHREEETRDTLIRDGLEDYVDLFRSDYRGFRDLAAEVATWWDLPALAASYQEFHDAHAPILAGTGSGDGAREPGDAAAFADYVATLTRWRRLPFLDPGLPAELLPADWPGAAAAGTFAAIRAYLAPAAQRFANAAGAGVPD